MTSAELACGCGVVPTIVLAAGREVETRKFKPNVIDGDAVLVRLVEARLGEDPPSDE